MFSFLKHLVLCILLSTSRALKHGECAEDMCSTGVSSLHPSSSPCSVWRYCSAAVDPCSSWCSGQPGKVPLVFHASRSGDRFTSDPGFWDSRHSFVSTAEETTCRVIKAPGPVLIAKGECLGYEGHTICHTLKPELTELSQWDADGGFECSDRVLILFSQEYLDSSEETTYLRVPDLLPAEWSIVGVSLSLILMFILVVSCCYLKTKFGMENIYQPGRKEQSKCFIEEITSNTRYWLPIEADSASCLVKCKGSSLDVTVVYKVGEFGIQSREIYSYALSGSKHESNELSSTTVVMSFKFCNAFYKVKLPPCKANDEVDLDVFESV